MSSGFLNIAKTPSVFAAQASNGSAGLYNKSTAMQPFAGLGLGEVAFIMERDSFYMASVSETGWPYVQHRGGPLGFLKILDDNTLGFLDFRGNRQYISVGNTAADNRVALILMDYVQRRRLKLYARVETVNIDSNPDLAARLVLPGYRGIAERIILLHVEAFDWNCPQHITRRFSEADINAARASGF